MLHSTLGSVAALGRQGIPLAVALLALVGCMSEESSDQWALHYTETFDSLSYQGLGERWVGLSSPNWSTVSREPFSDDGGWRLEDSALYGYTHQGFHNLTFRDTITGDMRVEWDITPLRKNLNLNCFIAARNRTSGYTFHVGGFENPSVAVLTKGASMVQLNDSRLPSPIAVGRTYHMRMEKEGQFIRLYMDGKRLFDYRDYDDLGGPGHQSFGFENNLGNRVRLDNVTVWVQHTTEDSSALALGTTAYQRGDYAIALRHLRDVPGDVDADTRAQALYRAARCLEALDSTDAALAQYQEIESVFSGREVAALSAGQRAAIAEDRGDTAAAGAIYRDMGKRYPGHAVLRTVLFGMGNARMARRNEIMLKELFRDTACDGSEGEWLRAQLLQITGYARELGVPVADNMFIQTLATDAVEACAVTRPELETLVPEDRTLLAELYRGANGSHIVAQRFTDVRTAYTEALNAMGENRRAVKVGASRKAEADALLELGRYDEILKDYTDQREACASAVFRLGEFDRLFEDFWDVTDTCIMAAWVLGRSAEYFKTVNPDYFTIATSLFKCAHKPQVALLVMEGAQVQYTFRDYLLINDIMRTLGQFTEGIERIGRTPNMEVPLAHNLIAMGRPDLAAATFPRLPQVQGPALLSQGLFDSLIEHCADDYLSHMHALILAGRHEELVSTYGVNARAVGLSLIANGRYEAFLERCPDLRPLRARVLNAMGRHNEVLSDYPNQRRECGRALIATGHADSALQRFPECIQDYADNLLENQQWQQVADRFANLPYRHGVAVVELGRPGEAAINRGKVWVSPQQACELHYRRALAAWMQGDRSAMDSLDAHPPVWFQHQWHGQRFNRYLLGPVLRGLAGDSAALVHGCQAVLGLPVQCFGRKLWYDASFLMGQIGTDEFLAQPHQVGTPLRLRLLTALRDDLRGKRSAALGGYRAWHDALASHVEIVGLDPLNKAETSLFTDLHASGTVRRLVQWRMETIARETDERSDG